MSFEHLPPTWTDRPLTDPAFAADVVDLLVSLGDRQLGTLSVILCHPDGRYRATVTIELPRIPGPTPTDICQTILAPLAASTHPPSSPHPSSSPHRSSDLDQPSGMPSPDPSDGANQSPGVDLSSSTTILLALGRRLGRTDDEEWAAAARAVCEAAGIRLLGFYVATKEGVRQPAIPALT